MYILLVITPLITSLLLVYIDISLIWIVFLIALTLLEIVMNDMIIKLDISEWFLNIKYSLIFDFHSILLISLMYIILNVVLIFTKYYVSKGLNKFLIYMNLFAFTMSLLIVSNNFYILFVGWELVGIMSYILIVFWSSNINNVKSGIKAILYNKIGDIGIIMIIIYYSNFNDYLLIGFILGCISKSAQIFLNGWLTSSMVAPTPVSSLLHSSTMVTAGVYILIKYNILWNELSIIGLLTIIWVSFLALYTNNIKSIVAYSTSAQLGYLTYNQLLGLNSMNHLLIHGFFKALLFISCGYIIHKYFNILDLRKYGFFIYYLPIEYILILISTLSLIGFPYFSGFYTKEYILLSSYHNNLHNYLLALIGSLLTILYSFRLIMISFMNRPRKYIKSEYTSHYYLLLLFIPSLILGSFIFKGYEDNENLSIIIKLLPFYMIVILLLSLRYIKIGNIFYIDELYNRFILFFYKRSYINMKLIENSIFNYVWLINVV